MHLNAYIHLPVVYTTGSLPCNTARVHSRRSRSLSVPVHTDCSPWIVPVDTQSEARNLTRRKVFVRYKSPDCACITFTFSFPPKPTPAQRLSQNPEFHCQLSSASATAAAQVPVPRRRRFLGQSPDSQTPSSCTQWRGFSASVVSFQSCS